jgi:hypothetical protein
MKTNKKGTYIIMRNSQKLDNNWLWSFYKEQGGKITDANEFIGHFYSIQQPISFNGEIIGYEKTQRDLNGFFEQMDKKFELTNLFDKEGNFLKVVV